MSQKTAEDQPVRPFPKAPIQRFLLATAVVSAIGLAPLATVIAAPSPIPASIHEGLARGVSLVFGWSDTDQYQPTEFDAELPLIRAAGGRHVRLPISMDILEDQQSGTLRADRWADLKRFVSEATRHQLVTVIDIHNTGHKNPDGSWNEDYMGGLRDPAVRKRHLSLMTELATRANEEMDKNWIVLQPANEPIFKDDPQVWYDYQDDLIPLMRKGCPECVMFVTGHNWQAPWAVMSHLKPTSRPWWDARLIVDLHLYSPLPLTHCSYPHQPNNCPGIAWPGTYEGQWLPVSGRQYTGIWDRTVLAAELGMLFAWGRENKVPFHFSEIGTTADLDDKVRGSYLKDLVSLLSENGAGYSCWEWNKNFGIKDHPETLKSCLADR